MSSLARRSLQTTAAAAGIAALGVGFAGSAFAAPELPAVDSAPDVSSAPSLPESAELLGMLGGVEGLAPTPEAGNIPGVFEFTAPSMSTAAAPDAGLPALPDAGLPALPDAGLPALPELASMPNTGFATAAPALPDAGLPALPDGAGALPDVSDPSLMQNPQVGALSGIDTATMMTEAMGAMEHKVPGVDVNV